MHGTGFEHLPSSQTRLGRVVPQRHVLSIPQNKPLGSFWPLSTATMASLVRSFANMGGKDKSKKQDNMCDVSDDKIRPLLTQDSR